VRYLIALTLTLALLVTACGRSSGQFGELVYSLTGGIAGFDQRMNISGDGAVQTAERGRPGKKGKLSAADLTALREAVAKVQWASLREQYVDPKVADAMFDGVTIKIGDKTYSTVVGTGGQAPGELNQLVELLKKIAAGHR